MNEATLDYIRAHREEDTRRLALGRRPEGVDLAAALEQIAGWQTARQKLPSWAEKDGILYPPRLSMEQCSSEQTARYKASLAQKLCNGNSMADLTGGLGVDFAFMARGFQRAVYVERQEQLCALARHNMPLLGVEAEVVCADGTDFLHTMEPVSLLFMDPARRDSHGGRTYGIADCTPDVLTLRDELLEKASVVMLKLSPMLDWRKAVSDLGEDCVSEVHIVSAAGECKELLVVMSRKQRSDRLKVVCVNDETVWFPGKCAASAAQLQSNNAATRGTLNCKETQNAMQKDPKRDAKRPKMRCKEGLFAEQGGSCYETKRPLSAAEEALVALQTGPRCETKVALWLYEPNASVMKSGFFDELCADFGVSQLAQNSHLFLSSERIEAFPGREFEVLAVTSMNKHELRQTLNGLSQANITVRNFPLTAEELRRRLKLKEGGSTYLFASTLASGEKVLLVTRKPCAH